MRLQAVLLQLDMGDPETAITSTVLRMVHSLAEVINSRCREFGFWKQDIGALTLIGPCAHFLLSIPRLPDHSDLSPVSEGLIIREMVRLVCLMLISGLRHLFGLPAVERVVLHNRFAKFVVRHGRSVSNDNLDLKVWAFVTAIFLQKQKSCQIYTELLLANIIPLGLSKPSLLSIARDTLWIDALATAQDFAEDTPDQSL